MFSSQNKAEGLAISAPAQEDSKEDFVFTHIKTPKLNNKDTAKEQMTPIGQLQKEILEENSPAVSIDSLGFKKIQPLTVQKTDENEETDPVTTSPLNFKRGKSTIEPLVSNSTSAQTLNTFYSAQSIHSSASETSKNYDENEHDQIRSTSDAGVMSNSSSANTTMETKTLLDNLNSPVQTNNTTVSSPSNKNEAKFLVFTNQFSNGKPSTAGHISTLTTKTVASSYYGEYNDGYTEAHIDDDRTPIISNFNVSSEKFEKIIQEGDDEEFEDLNRTPLVRQTGFDTTPEKQNVQVVPSSTPAAQTALANPVTTGSSASATSSSKTLSSPALQKSNSGTANRFLSKFRKKIKAPTHTRGQSVNESVKSRSSDKDDLTSMDHDASVSEKEYQEYAMHISPPPPPVPVEAPLTEAPVEEEFSFVSPTNINKATDVGSMSASTLDQKSNTTFNQANFAGPGAKALKTDDDDDDLYHSYKPEKSTIDEKLQPPSDIKKQDDAAQYYDDGEEVYIEQLDKNGYAVGADKRAELKLSPAKSIGKSSPAAQRNGIKSPNELNKDIFENFRPSFAASHVLASPSSSHYPDLSSPATNQFSIGTSQLDKRDLFSPTDSTFSAMSEKRHTQVKLLNRSTTNLLSKTTNKDIIEEQSSEEQFEDVNSEDEEELLLNEETLMDQAVHKKFADQPDILKELANTEDDNYARLFLTATHPFDASTLDSQDDAARCLSFKKDDIAFIHDISEASGWAEVTLLSYKIETGWVPLNYFMPTIEDDEKLPLLLLFKSAGNFLSNRQSRPIYSSKTGQLKGHSFSYTTIEKVTVGVKYFLIEIGCLSSKNETVYLSKIIREVRKKLLQDWHILRQKSREYVGTTSISKIELLELLVYQVLMKAIMFLNIWKSENVFKSKINVDKFKIDNKVRPYLSYTPTLRERIKEDFTIFISYFSLIIGRMDLIEHNIAGVNLLKIINQQIDLLYLDFKFVVTEAASILQEDRYITLVTAFGKLIKEFGDDCDELVAVTKREYGSSRAGLVSQTQQPETQIYLYTTAGKKLLQTCASLITDINKIAAVEVILARERVKNKVEHSYIDFQKRKIEAKDFIEQASMGLIESNKFNKQLARKPAASSSRAKYAKRFSVFRNGNSDSLLLTADGVDLLTEMISGNDNTLSPMFNDGEFGDLNDSETNLKENPYYIKNLNNEILKDANGVLIGSSFRGLVYFLTNELEEPNELFISTFFLCYKTFSSGEDLLDALITRFGVNDKELSGVSDNRIRNRRKLVLRMITIWLSSYWAKIDDFKILPKLMNFLNEFASDHLPLETLQLIKLVATLINSPADHQIVSRSLLPRNEPQDKRFSTMFSDHDLDDEDDDLVSIHSRESLNSLTSASSVLTKSDIQEIESAVAVYRNHMGPHWKSNRSLKELIENWYAVRSLKMRFPSKPLLLLDFQSINIAKQLTLMESEMFNNIKIEELLNDNFTEKKLHLNLSPNVRKSILFTNSLSEYVLETIIQPDIPLKQRAKTITKWLKIALNCFELRNFNSLAAIMTSLQSFLISRCVKIWSLITANYQSLYERLIKIIQPDKNYLTYRKKLWSYLNGKDQTIVPYLNLFLQDLTFIMEGNSNYRSAKTFLNQKLINIDKYFKVTKILGDLQKLQKDYKSSNTGLNGDFMHKSTSSSRIRKSLSRLSLMSSSDLGVEVMECMPLQELMLMELLRVRQLNIIDDDRAWKLSCLIQPREN